MGAVHPPLDRVLEGVPEADRYLVAFSGGLDSTVLLHLLRHSRRFSGRPLLALHVHHGIHVEADRWVEHCAAVCGELGVPLRSVWVEVSSERGESVESMAREARYRALKEWVEAGDLLLLAHHGDDQAETLLLQLLRGAGTRGLAAMPAVSPFGLGQMARPLLGWSQHQLRAYAAQHRLEWVEDDSNRNTRFSRNYLRAEVLPLLRNRWPSLHTTLSRSARHCAEAAQLIEALGGEDLARCAAGDEQHGNGLSAPLLIPSVLRLSDARQRNLLRTWVEGAAIPVPSSAVLRRVGEEVIAARPGAMPLVSWRGGEIRRYRDRLYLMHPLPPAARYSLRWDGATPLPLPADRGVLIAESVTGGVCARRWQEGVIEVRSRSGGERCRPAGEPHHRTLKQLFQREAIPPWERSTTPLIYIDGQLAVVAGLWVCEGFAAQPGSPGVMPRWRQAPGLGRASGGRGGDPPAGPPTTWYGSASPT